MADSISFFEIKPGDTQGEELPSYQVSFTLFENGVAENLGDGLWRLRHVGKARGIRVAEAVRLQLISIIVAFG